MATWVQRVAEGVRTSLVPLAIASFAGYVRVAGTFLIYDTSGGSGPLAAFGDSPVLPAAYRFFSLVLAPLTYAIATWHLNARGALIALAGIGFAGPLLWGVSPWSHVDAEARLGYYDETRGWIGLGLAVFGIGCFFIIPPVTYLVHWAWRRLRAPRSGPHAR